MPMHRASLGRSCGDSGSKRIGREAATRARTFLFCRFRSGKLERYRIGSTILRQRSLPPAERPKKLHSTSYFMDMSLVLV
mmetsp:Transcript_42619/g.90635  ORF Transcript_42619/g.90635 Transcript_42619/m.90635 type:complete len:80 (+) Transcript_42619:20-259(+)